MKRSTVFDLEFLTEEADFWEVVKEKEPEKSTPVRWVRLLSRHKGDGVLAGCNS